MRIAIIPARGGSRRIPRKNVREFMGKPIIGWSIEVAEESEQFDQIIVSTDDAEIDSVAREYGASTLIRPAEFAQDECGTQEVFRHAIDSLRMGPETIVCGIYATAPLITPNDLNVAAALLMLRPASYVVAVGAQPLRDAGAFYFGAAHAFLHRVPLWTMTTAAYVLPEERVCDINDEHDWNEALTKFEHAFGSPA